MKHSTATNGRKTVFVDTWGWLVLGERRSPHHAAVLGLRSQAAQGAATWVTTDYVLDETITRVFGRQPFAEARAFCEGILAARESGALTVETTDAARFARAWQLRLRYRDKPAISFTDLVSFVVMSELRIRQVITADEHFRKVQLGFELLP